jgi:glycosyltransferase involved in cell wall biosynthesis
MNIIIANGQEFNPQSGGIERDSVILAKKLLSLDHNVYFIACRLSQYPSDYTPAAEQIFLPDQFNFLTNDNISFFSDFVLKKKIDFVLNQAGDILDFSVLCSEAVKNTNAKLISINHFDPLSRINQLSDFSKSILNVKNIFQRIIKRIFFPYRYLIIRNYEKNLHREIYLRSNSMVLLSKYFIPSFLKLTGFPPEEKLTAILNPSALMHKIPEVVRKKQILYVGRINYFQKRTDRIIEIWENLYTTFPDWQLVIVGDGPLLNDLKKYVSGNNIERVTFKGICDPAIHYQESEIVCMTSNYEGLGMVLIEGSQFGCVPIAFDSYASVHEIIEDHVNGIIIEKFDMPGYIMAMKELMSNENLREKLRQATSNIQPKFDPDLISQQWISLLDKLTKSNKKLSIEPDIIMPLTTDNIKIIPE